MKRKRGALLIGLIAIALAAGATAAQEPAIQIYDIVVIGGRVIDFSATPLLRYESAPPKMMRTGPLMRLNKKR